MVKRGWGVWRRYGGAVPLLVGSSSAHAHLSLPVELGRQDDGKPGDSSRGFHRFLLQP